MRFSNNLAFKRLLDERKEDIQQLTNDGVQETNQFKRLSSLLATCRHTIDESDFRLILISKDDLLKLFDDAHSRVINLFNDSRFLTNRTVYVDASLTILNCNNDSFPEENNEARRFFASLTEDNDLVAFHVAPNATINYFIKGKDFGDGIFYTRDALNRYEELKTIDKLSEVLDDYRISLRHQNTYLKFFVPKSSLRALHDIKAPDEDSRRFIENHKHLLNNKPEELFREDIRNYIKQHMKVHVTREVTLENLDRLDIELTDEKGNDMYFIEIKWVGESINADGNDFATEYKASPRIKPDAVQQVVGYINELLLDKQNVKQGFLAVFDARKEDLPDTGTEINENDVSPELRKYFPRFKKLNDFRVKNINPR